jgi:hypothetical protein
LGLLLDHQNQTQSKQRKVERWQERQTVNAWKITSLMRIRLFCINFRFFRVIALVQFPNKIHSVSKLNPEDRAT